MLIYIRLLSDLAQFAQVSVCFAFAATCTGSLGFCLDTCMCVVIFVRVGVCFCVCVYMCVHLHVIWLVFAILVLDRDALCEQGLPTAHNFCCSRKK